MHLHINHCYCTKPSWEGLDFYDSKYMVTIEEYVSYRHKAYEDSVREAKKPESLEQDWKNLIDFKDIFDQEEYDEEIERFKKRESDLKKEQIERWAKAMATKSEVPSLKKEVVDWLNENIKDNLKDKDQPQGWCVGNDSYRSTSHCQLNLWFYRRGDAMKFIKVWSSHQKPTTYLDYFKDIYKELVDGKLTVIDRD